MLPKYRRVTKSLFNQVIKEGKTLHGDLLYLRFVSESLDSYSHIAFVAPKTVAKLAVDRNKLRRRGYSAVSSIEIKPIIGVFFFKKEAQKAFEKNDLEQDILNILRKIRF